MNKKDTYISSIIEQLQSGVVNAEKAASVFCSEFHVSERTFYKYWKLANEKYKEQQKEIEKELLEQYKGKEKERLKSALISREKYNEMVDNAFKISYNEMIKDKSKQSIDAFMKVAERKSKIEGWDAPTKTQNEHKFDGFDDLIIE